jgi:hypothetical protein
MLEDKEQDEPLLSRMCERGACHPLLHGLCLLSTSNAQHTALRSRRLHILPGPCIVPSTVDLRQRTKRSSGTFLHGCDNAVQSLHLAYQVCPARFAIPCYSLEELSSAC